VLGLEKKANEKRKVVRLLAVRQTNPEANHRNC
jgi:hypothetical protein